MQKKRIHVLLSKEITNRDIIADIVNYLIWLLYPRYKDDIKKLLDQISNMSKLEISLYFFNKNDYLLD